jgi:predicted transcriptional regulator
MEFMMKIHMMVATLALTLGGAALAQTSTPRIHQRETRQDQRIEQGTASGALTQQEADRLTNSQARVDNAQTQAQADGKVTRRERARLHHMQNKQSRHIKRQKHDRQTTTPAG